MIEKITDHNLERYDSRLKEWCDRKFFEKGNYGKYQTTEEAGAVAFYPAPDTPLEGKVKFSFKETPPSSGDKSPNNPSTIAGVSSVKVTRCGKNLIKTPFFSTGGSYVFNGVTFTLNHNNGTIMANGTASPNDARLYIVGSTSHIRLLGGKQYRLSGCPSGGGANTYAIGASRYTVNGTAYLSNLPSDTGSGVLWDIATDCSFVSSVWIKAGTEVSNLVFKPQLELGSAITDFELYAGADADINLGSTFYGGEIDLATGLMTVTHKCIIYTDAPVNWYDDFTQVGNYYAGYSNSYRAAPKNSQGAGAVSSHFNYGTSGNNYRFYITGTGDVCLVTEYSSKDSLNAWLASQYENGTPVTIVYEIANPLTVQLTPQQILSLSQTDKYTPRLNTVYTDADSVQISYLKSPIRDEYEKTQAILSLGGNS